MYMIIFENKAKYVSAKTWQMPKNVWYSNWINLNLIKVGIHMYIKIYSCNAGVSKKIYIHISNVFFAKVEAVKSVIC